MKTDSLRTTLLAIAIVPMIATTTVAEEATPVVATDTKADAVVVPVSTVPAFVSGINYNGGTAIINFVASVSDKTAADLAQLAQNAAIGGADSIRINVSSRGGSVHAMHFMVNALQNLPVPVETVAMSPLASAAVALYCAGEKRYMPAGSSLYLHQQSGFYQIENKTAAAVARENKITDLWYDNLLRACTNGESDVTALDYSARDVVIDAEQAMFLGMATGPMSDLRGGKIWGAVTTVTDPEKAPSMGMPFATYR